jgi:hypothetical protein
VCDLDVELLGELTIHRLYNRSGTVDQAADQLLHKRRHLVVGVMLLVAPRQRHEGDVIMAAQLFSQVLVYEAFVSHNIQMGVSSQQRCPCLVIGYISPNQLEVEYGPSQCSEQMQLVAEHGPLLGARTPKGSPLVQPLPKPTRAGYQMEANYLHRESIEHTLAVAGNVQAGKSYAPEQVETLSQVAPSPVEAALGGYVRKQVEVAIRSPVTEQFGFYVPPPTLANQHHGYQLTVRALWRGAGALEQVLHLLPNIINHTVHVQAEILKVGYH